MRTFFFTLASDTGRHVITTNATSEAAATDTILTSQNCPASAILKVVSKPLPQKIDTYFETMGAAIDAAKFDAEQKGYEVVNNALIFAPVNYGHSERFFLELTKDGKHQRKALIIVLYRMDSGRYELTHYIN